MSNDPSCTKRQEHQTQSRDGKLGILYRCTEKKCEHFTKKVGDAICAACPLRTPPDITTLPAINPNGPKILEDGTIIYKRTGWVPPAPHPGYRRKSNVIDSDDAWVFIPEATLIGPGSELHRMLAAMGIYATAGCKCREHMNEMDAKGPQWCRDNLETILGWIREEARTRKLPYVNFVVRRMVLKAIRTAEKKIAEREAQKAAKAA